MLIKRSISSKFKDTLTKTKSFISHQPSESTSSADSEYSGLTDSSRTTLGSNAGKVDDMTATYDVAGGFSLYANGNGSNGSNGSAGSAGSAGRRGTGSRSRRQSSVSLRSSASIRRKTSLSGAAAGNGTGSRSRSGTTNGSGLNIGLARREDVDSVGHHDKHGDDGGDDGGDDDDDHRHLDQIDSPERSTAENSETILLPTVDKSVPPCTTEDLTPIIPITLEELQRSLAVDAGGSVLTNDEVFADHSVPGSPISVKKRPLIMSTLSTTSTAATLASVDPADHLFDDSLSTAGSSTFQSPRLTQGATFGTGNGGTLSFPSSPLQSSRSKDAPAHAATSSIGSTSLQDQQTTSDLAIYGALEEDGFKNHVDPVFLKANQIDHYDRALDRQKNDKLADQMALNILQNIAEEDGDDELAMFREEIPVHFAQRH